MITHLPAITQTTMLLEDLGASGFTECGHAVLDYNKPLEPAIKAASLQTLARLHAWGWGGHGMERTEGLTPLTMGYHWVSLRWGHQGFSKNGTDSEQSMCPKTKQG